jgi:hypothetical protein
MADIGQVLATGGTTIVGVAVGAGLTYWFGAMNRRHQEAREDATRGYEAKLQAYADFLHTVHTGLMLAARDRASEQEKEGFITGLMVAFTPIRFVGSQEAREKGRLLYVRVVRALRGTVMEDEGLPDMPVGLALEGFEAAARKDLGRP